MGTDHFISLQKGIDMTTLYRHEKESILTTAYRNQDILPLSETFDRTAFDTVLAQDGCTALRIYSGMSEDLKVHAIVVGVNEDNEDILPSLAALSTVSDTTDDGGIIEVGIRCPPDCPPASDLNS